jgi:hypothetical protein
MSQESAELPVVKPSLYMYCACRLANIAPSGATSPDVPPDFRMFALSWGKGESGGVSDELARR